MNNNIFYKIAYSILIAIIICSVTLSIYATSTTELQNQKSEVQDKINETSSEIAGVHSKMTKALNEISDLNDKIENCETKITELENQIEQLNFQIDEKQKNIEEQQHKYEEQQKLLEKRLVALYKSGNTTYLDVLLSSSSLSDFISKYYFIEKLAKCDTDLLTQIQNLKVEIEKEKEELQTNKIGVENAKLSVENEKKSIERLASQKQRLVVNLSAEEKELQVQLDEYEKDKKEILNEIAKVEAENKRKREEAERAAAASAAANNVQNNSSTSIIKQGNNNSYTPSSPSVSGFICPLSGRNKNDITTGYMAYTKHTGVDFARNSKGPVQGLPVLAAKSGVVFKSLAKKIGNTYVSYGEYIVIDHEDGTYTLYAHMEPGSRKVKKGDRVSQGQQIGNVGTTGNSTGYHLHFEIYTGSGYLNPAKYLP